MGLGVAAEPMRGRGIRPKSKALGHPIEPSFLQDAPEPDQDRLGGVVPQKRGPGGTGPLDHPVGQGIGTRFGSTPALLLSRAEEPGPPVLGADLPHRYSPSPGLPAPDLGDRPAPFAYQ